ncbi:MAG: hypothetical protein JW913_19530 [Chitinispirillaceae bacterium]|nr:hypothetical protein [Chitinispirillaceae bacterium]
MMKKVAFLCSVCFALIFWRCDCGQGTAERTVFSAKLGDNDVSQWVQDDEGYKVYKTYDELYAAINGGAEEYIQYGLIEGFWQKMTKGSYYVDCSVMDFGTVEKATAMYQYKADQVSPKTAAGSYPDTIAIIDDSFITGCMGYAHFGQYYLQLSLSGYGANKPEGVQNAARYIEVFEGRINQL